MPGRENSSAPNRLRASSCSGVTARAAIAAQRELAVEEEEVARKAILEAGGEVVELTPQERSAFARAVKPLHDEARSRFGAELFSLPGK